MLLGILEKEVLPNHTKSTTELPYWNWVEVKIMGLQVILLALQCQWRIQEIGKGVSTPMKIAECVK